MAGSIAPLVPFSRLVSAGLTFEYAQIIEGAAISDGDQVNFSYRQSRRAGFFMYVTYLRSLRNPMMTKMSAITTSNPRTTQIMLPSM